MAKPRIHLDATKAGHELRMGGCGLLGVETTHNLPEVTCKMCLSRARRMAAPAAPNPKGIRGGPTGDDLARVYVEAFSATLLAPAADPPPRLDPVMWASSCRGGEARCHDCPLCEWEREAEKWHALSPWNKRHRVKRPPTAPRWPSLAAALCAFVEWEQSNRWGPSSMGPILTRIEYGRVDGGGVGMKEDPVMRRASEMVRVRQALETAYPEGAHAKLTAAQCVGVLLARTAGALGAMAGPKERKAGLAPAVRGYEELAGELGVTVGDLRALVKRGRQRVTVELAARGLIPMPRAVLGLAEEIEVERGRLVANG